MFAANLHSDLHGPRSCRKSLKIRWGLYYERENNTGGHQNHPENAVGLALYLFFSVEGK